MKEAKILSHQLPLFMGIQIFPAYMSQTNVQLDRSFYFVGNAEMVDSVSNLMRDMVVENCVLTQSPFVEM